MTNEISVRKFHTPYIFYGILTNEISLRKFHTPYIILYVILTNEISLGEFHTPILFLGKMENPFEIFVSLIFLTRRNKKALKISYPLQFSGKYSYPLKFFGNFSYSLNFPGKNSDPLKTLRKGIRT